MKSLIAITALVLSLAPITEVAAEPIAESSIRAIESQMVMPRRARHPLESYDRYYAVDRISGREVVVGRYLLRTPERQTRAGFDPVPAVPNAFTTSNEKNLPLILDGGCSVVTVYFDIATQRLIKIAPPSYESAETELGLCNGPG